MFLEGIGEPNEAGFAYYDALIDALLESGIVPWVTLYHWDLPSALYTQDGWLNPDPPDLHTPATDSAADVDAARQAIFDIDPARWTFNYSWYCDPVILGNYPVVGLEIIGKDVPAWTAQDMDTICQPLDLFGVNINTGDIARAGADGKPEALESPCGYPTTMFRWTINPSSMYWGPKFLQERYKLLVVITENGLASMDWVHSDGNVHDPGRIDYLTRYLSELRRASEDGVDVRGYFQWSIMDDFEWAEGYALRFGLVYLDYTTLRRDPKDS